jgi:hypothetical protein
VSLPAGAFGLTEPAYLLQQAVAAEPGRVRLGYEIVWRRAEVEGVPTDLLDLLNARFQVISFDLVSESPP